MDNNLSSGKVVSVTNVDHNSNQIVANNQLIDGQIISKIPISTGIDQNDLLNDSQTCSNANSNLAISQTRGVIERGASWSYNETRALLSLWGQDMVQRQLTNSKRTRHVWEKIAEKLNELGYSRSPDQVRTRVFNMIAEYRRILKNPTPERKKKCTFFEALQKIYQAKDASQVRQACRSLDNCEEDHLIDTIDFNCEEQDSFLINNLMFDNYLTPVETSDPEDKEIFSYSMSPSHFNPLNQFNQISHMQMNGLNHQIVHFNNNVQNSRNRTPTAFPNTQNLNESLNSTDQLDQQFINQTNVQHHHKQAASQQNSQTNSLNGDLYYSDNQNSENSRDQFTSNFSNQTTTNQTKNKHAKQMNDSQSKKKHKTNDYEKINNINMHADSYLNVMDTTTLLIDKMFEHLANGTETMREWIKLEERRLEQDIIRRREDREREERREQKYLEAFIKMQSQMFKFLGKQTSDTKIIDEAMNVNLINDLREDVNKNDQDVDETKQKSIVIDRQQLSNCSNPEDKNEENQIPDSPIESKFASQIEGTISTIDNIGDHNFSIVPDQHFIHTNLVELDDQHGPVSNSNLVIKEQSQHINQVSLKNLLKSTNHINNTLLQTSNQSIKNSDRDYYSLLTHPRQQKIVIDQERINSEIVDLEFAYKDDHECNNYNFTNVQHEEIVN